MMVSAAVHNAGIAVRDQLISLAVADAASPLHGAGPAERHRGRRAAWPLDSGDGETYAA